MLEDIEFDEMSENERKKLALTLGRAIQRLGLLQIKLLEAE